MRTVKKKLKPNQDDAPDHFSQPSVFIRVHLHAQLENGWWHRANTMPPHLDTRIKDPPLGCGLYGLFLVNQVRFLIEFLFYLPQNSTYLPSQKRKIHFLKPRITKIMDFDFLIWILSHKKLAKPQNPAGIPTFLWQGVYQTDFSLPPCPTLHFFSSK